MTGPEHYREAERLTALAARSGHEKPEWAAGYLKAAQVHATLALAAAAAVSGNGNMPVPDCDAWTAAASAYRPPVKLNGDPS